MISTSAVLAASKTPKVNRNVGNSTPATNTADRSNLSEYDLTNSNAGGLVDLFYRARVLRILEEGKEIVDGQLQDHQKLELEITNGDEQGKVITIDHGGTFAIEDYQKVKEGEEVVLDKTPATGGQASTYYIVDKYRLPNLLFVIVLFFILAIYFGHWRGVTSIIGMLFSVAVIFYYLIPQITKGGDPFWAFILGALVIILFSLYLSHGFNKRTTIALLSTILALGLTVAIDLLFIYIAKLAGNGTEEALNLQFGQYRINLKGLLLGGIIIGVLGVLDDVTTGQAAAIEEISLANRNLTFKELYRSGMSVGREHIASLINTLVLAYAGVSFPLLLLYSTNKLEPLWKIINSNFISEEIVRTLVGSSVLVLAVPLTAVLAAYFYSRRR